MGIKKTKEGTYIVQYSQRHPITKQPVSRRRKGIKSRIEANRVYAALAVEVNDRMKRIVVPTWSQTLGEYIIRLDMENEITKGTVYKRDKVLRRHTTQSWGNRCIDEISAQDIRDLLSHALSESSESHRKFFIKGVRGVFEFAVDRGYIQKNPTPKIKFKISDKIMAVLNQSQIMTLLRKAQEQNWDWFPHYALALFTGLRSGELYALTWDNVNIEKRIIIVNCSWSSKDGFKSTKSGDDRVVEIPEPLVPILAELKIKSTLSKFVLPHLPKWTQGEQARDLRLFLKSNGLPEVRFHDLRASWATLLLSKGVPPSKVMSMGGWKDMDTMMVYVRKAGIDIKGSTSCLDGLAFHKSVSGKILEMIASK